MPDLTWRDAILRVLRGASEPMHYTEIAEAIAEQGLRSDLGATPATSVSATIAAQLEKDVVRVARGYYALAPSLGRAIRPSEAQLDSESDETGLINALACTGLDHKFCGHRLRIYWANNSPAAIPLTSAVSAASICFTTAAR